jgi:hypothetical protein
MPNRGAAKVTTDHEKIRRWVEERGGHPASVRRTGGARDPGLLRIDYPGYRGEQSLEPLSWKQFFRKFDESDLAFLYQDRTASGRLSRFSKLVDRSKANGRSPARRARSSNGKSRARSQSARGRAASSRSGRAARSRAGSGRRAHA